MPNGEAIAARRWGGWVHAFGSFGHYGVGFHVVSVWQCADLVVSAIPAVSNNVELLTAAGQRQDKRILQLACGSWGVALANCMAPQQQGPGTGPRARRLTGMCCAVLQGCEGSEAQQGGARPGTAARGECQSKEGFGYGHILISAVSYLSHRVARFCVALTLL